MLVLRRGKNRRTRKNFFETPGFEHGPQWWSPGKGKCYDPCAAGLTLQVRQEHQIVSHHSPYTVFILEA